MALVKQNSVCWRPQIFRNHLQVLLWQTPASRYVSLLPAQLPNSPFRPLLRLRSPSFSPRMSSLTTSPAESTPTPTTKTERVVIKGRVQGVYYRDWTVQNATELGLKGWVGNRKDGSVEALFSGPPETVQEMQQRCRRGPRTAIVTGLEAFPCNEDPGTGFERRPTV